MLSFYPIGNQITWNANQALNTSQMTGSGKSTFIQKLTGSMEAVVGDGLASCTFDSVRFYAEKLVPYLQRQAR
jgi:tRNA A37 threonylcarbamoyladenosine biosynthesis protein TsaE